MAQTLVRTLAPGATDAGGTEVVIAPTRAIFAVAAAAASAVRTWEKSAAADAADAKEATIGIEIGRRTTPTGIAGEAVAGGCETFYPPS